MAEFKTVTVAGTGTARMSRAEIIDAMLEDCERARRGGETCKLVFDLNGHGIALSRWNAAFQADMRQADIVHADGQPIVVASRLLTDTPIPERSATTDLFHDAAAAAPKIGLRFFLLGASENVNAKCEARMTEMYPDLVIAGRRNGYFSEAEEVAICDEINALRIDVLWVGLGKPKEQAFCVRNRHRLNVGWAVTCGGCFNYVVGEYPRAPNWMRNSGLEWLHRMATRPKLLTWRYLTTNPVAFYMLIAHTRSSVSKADA